MTNQNNGAKAKASAYCQEDLKPLVQRLDNICDRLELVEAIAELFYQWKRVDTCEPHLSSQTLGVIGFFIWKEANEIQHEIASEIMDRLSVIENRKEVKP